MKTGPIKLIVGLRNTLTTTRSCTMTDLSWMKSYSLRLLGAHPCLTEALPSSDILWFKNSLTHPEMEHEGACMAWECNRTRWAWGHKEGAQAGGPSLPEHNLLQRQKISEIFWKPSARSFSFTLPFLIFFRIRKDEKFYNALRKTFKLVEKSYSIEVLSPSFTGDGAAKRERHEMTLLGFNPETTTPCGKPSETVKCPGTRSSQIFPNLRHESEERRQVFKAAADSPPYC